MELKDFVFNSISEIIDATTELKEKYEPQGVIINPPQPRLGSDVMAEGGANSDFGRVERIAFDVAVTVGSGGTTKGGGGINVFSASVAASKEASSSSESVTRIQFSIPVAFAPSSAEERNGQGRENRPSASQGPGPGRVS